MVAIEPGNPGKCPFVKKVSENMEKSGKTVEKAYKSGRSQEIILDQC